MAEHFELPKETMAKNEKRKQRNTLIILFAALAVLIIIIAIVLFVVLYMPNFKQVPPDEYFGISEMPVVVIGGERIGAGGAVYYNGEIYLSVGFAKEHIDEHIFFDQNGGVVSLATPFSLYRITEGENKYQQDFVDVSLPRSAFIREGEMYLPSVFISAATPYYIWYSEKSHTVVADLVYMPLNYAEVTAKEANVRYEPDVKSPIQLKLSQNDRVTVFDDTDEKFSKVRTSEGYIGYIDKSHVKAAAATEPLPPPPAAKPLLLDEPVVMLWDQIYSKNDNQRENKLILRDGVNVLSPTWFSFDINNLDGTITDLADRAYVDAAHKGGAQVWAVLTDNFKTEVCDKVLTSPSDREYIITQLMDLVKIYNLDGINIDFEMVSTYAAPYYVQFLRELAVFTRKEGIVLSVDMFVPTYTMYYNREEVIKAADYICLMAYDEHYGAASGAGPVASLPFVEDGIVKTLREVPAERLILGLPFYTRVWREEKNRDGTISVSVANNFYMGVAEREFYNNGAGASEWQPSVGSYYNEYKTNEEGADVTYKVWIEDETSIREKMKLYEKYGLAGVAGWSRGMESDEAWDVIMDFIK